MLHCMIVMIKIYSRLEDVARIKSFCCRLRYNIVYLFRISERNLSKGELDKRVFLDNKSISDVANLLMFGTPNAGVGRTCGIGV